MMTKKQITKFVEPSDLAGEWADCRGMYFWHHKTPVAMKRVIEKTSGTRLCRDTTETARLSYGGAIRGGGELQAIWLRFEAVVDARKLYSLVVKRTAPRRWVTRASFTKDARQTFASWTCKFEVPALEIPWADASPGLFEELKRMSIALEAGAAGPAAQAPADKTSHPGAPQREKVFFTAHKDAGLRPFFDAQAPAETSAREPQDGAVVACLDDFFDWSRRQDPHAHNLAHSKGGSEADSWKRIVHQLVARNA
jgi:hypothetical protein